MRASLGEISDACEVVVGRYKAIIRLFQACIHQKLRKTQTSRKLASFASNSLRKRPSASYHDR